MSRNGNLNTLNSQFQIITQDGLIENDKERIKKKLNLKNSSRCGSEKNSDILILNYDYQNISTLKNNITITENDKKENDGTSSSETLRNNQIKKEINVSNHIILNENTNHFSDSEDLKNNEDYNVEESQITNLSKIMQLNNSSSAIYNKVKKTQNVFNDNSQEKSDVSALGLLDDEHVISRNHQESVTKFKFIHEIQKNNLSYENIPFKKFMALDNKCTFNIFSFLYDNYKIIMTTGKKIKNAFNLTLKSKFSYIIENFKSKYKEILQFESFKFIQSETIMLNKKKIPIFSVFLKCQIKETPYLLKYEEISYEISYSFKYY